MASLRLLCFPATTCFPIERQFQLSSQCHISATSNSLKLPFTTKRVNTNFVLHCSSTAQDQALQSSPVSGATTSSESEELESDTEEVYKDRLYAQNVPWNYTPEDIRALFDKYGTVVDVELSMYNKTRNRGLAFVTMGSPEEALAALNNLQSCEVDGRVITLDYARPRKKKVVTPPQPKPEVTFNLFVANLSFEARAKDLKEFFNYEGHSVVSAEVIFHENPRRSLGYGFVSFKSKKEADAALTSIQGKLFMGRPIRVARSKQFVKQPAKEGAESEDTSQELNSGVEEAEVAN
ncbi:28 kDa ribonucleoprotein, chloroplastic [Cannabis sativa]|uniref:28 kDa ribonucleoprotein, chloroplastic n=1 Tax=Cannabis sativa TaxID=3483 RepID=UPI0029CA784C|nr:28 kDa ribonucleoprotein, chloroplastic [Cannabis sativa]XP_030482755.2 28 kDa ribonucleoprotein, chloroplastic [Cannabis sativa]